MLIVTLSLRESEPSAVTWTGVRSGSAWGVLDLESFGVRGGYVGRSSRQSESSQDLNFEAV